MRPIVCFVCLLALGAGAARGQGTFTSSHLPIVVIDTGGRGIPNEPKVTARMGIVDNGEGRRNAVTDPFNGYDGVVGIEVRGSSTQMFPKKQYAVETRDAEGENRNVSLLGLPEENDWVLSAPYSDKSLLRNVLAYDVARGLGRYASRTRWCELVLDGQYQGVYILMEKIKQDRNRVAVAGLDPDDTDGDALTGGYIVKVDKWEGSGNDGWASAHLPRARADRPVLYQYHDPQAADLAAAQKAYIRQVVTAFEDVMAGDAFADPAAGYPALLDVGSAVDFFIVNELGRNVDGYRLSSFLYKDRDSRGGRLVVGPVWDFNLAFGNADYYNGSAIEGWQVHFGVATDDFQVPFWWDRLLQDPAFRAALAARWRVLRQGPLHTDSLLAVVDAHVAALGDAVDRNFARWPVLGRYVWPNNFVGGSYAREIQYLKQWVSDRASWIDRSIDQIRPVGGEGVPVLGLRVLGVTGLHPNPGTGEARLTLQVGSPQHVDLTVYDALGRRVARLHAGELGAGEHPFRFDTSAWAPGVYVVRAAGVFRSVTHPFVVAR